jgi:type IV pilus assembly protein PilW
LRYKNKNNGFSSVEIMVSTAIAMVVLAAVSNTFIGQTRYYNAQEHVNEMQQNGRAALDLMSREIKLAGYDPTGTAIGNGIPYSPAQLQLLADLDGDGSTAGTDENIIYAYDAANLRIQRTTGGTTMTLTENISDFTFDYLDASGNPTTIAGNIRQIRISITARTSKPDPNYTANNGYMTYQLTALITPKNLCYKAGSCP